MKQVYDNDSSCINRRQSVVLTVAGDGYVTTQQTLNMAIFVDNAAQLNLQSKSTVTQSSVLAPEMVEFAYQSVCLNILGEACHLTIRVLCWKA